MKLTERQKLVYWIKKYHWDFPFITENDEKLFMVCRELLSDYRKNFNKVTKFFQQLEREI